MPNFAAFLSYIVLTAYTPGPNNIMAMSNASKYGFRKSMPFCFGVFLGFAAVMACCAIFSALLFNFIPVIEPYMKFVGAAYILWLAFVIYRDKPHGEKKKIMDSNSLFTGMVLQFVNVKVILYGISAMTTFILPYYKALPVVAMFTAVLCINGASGTVCWAVFGSVFQKLFTNHRKAMNLIMALLLVYCAVSTVMK